MMTELKDVETDFLVEELKKRGYLHVFWMKDDVEASISELGYKPTEEAVTAVANIIEHYFDASIGVSWDVIGVHVHEYFNPRDDEKN